MVERCARGCTLETWNHLTHVLERRNIECYQLTVCIHREEREGYGIEEREMHVIVTGYCHVDVAVMFLWSQYIHVKKQSSTPTEQLFTFPVLAESCL